MAGIWLRRLSAVVCFLTALTTAHAANWFPLGPFGGDARSLAADPGSPRRVYLGTDTGWIYRSEDGGTSWTRVTHLAHRDDLVIDDILVDSRNPKRLIAAAYCKDKPDGGLFISEDGGNSWYEQAQMSGQSVRSLGRAPSDPNELIAGTLKGVYRSTDDAKHWELISPAGSTELHEVESVAIDPADSNVIYAGTWHLPWKTVDGGAHWVNIKEGIIDDSDVFSIIVDPKNPKIVYASACSGIYKSETAAEPNPRDQDKRFDKLGSNGVIPSAARRTRKLGQDPEHLETVFAGTTEGLYRTIDGGRHWDRMTGAEIIVNDVWVDPTDSNHVLIATERGGVLASVDGGVSFAPSNAGFTNRQVVAVTTDPATQAVYIGLVNDKADGGVFKSTDGGITWLQDASGLGGRDVFSLAPASDGTLLAGTAHGVFRLADDSWADSSAMDGENGEAAASPAAAKQTQPARARARPTKRPVRRPAVAKPAIAALKRLDTIVYALAPSDRFVYAGTSDGLMVGDSTGKDWKPVESLQMPDTRFVAVRQKIVMAATLRRIEISMDEGTTWDPVALPAELTMIGAVAIDEKGNLWAGGREGVYYSTDYGATWKTIKNLFVTQVDNIYADDVGHRVFVTASNSPFAFSASLPDYKVTFWDTGWPLRFMHPAGSHLIAASMFDGIVVQPRMVDSKFADDARTAAASK
jgi:photosystem II stability/assembly factor-like uncharacterized protein